MKEDFMSKNERKSCGQLDDVFPQMVCLRPLDSIPFSSSSPSDYYFFMSDTIGTFSNSIQLILMPNLVSPAQVLPPHILRRIIQYSAVEANKKVGQLLPDRHVARAMLYLCSSWRLAALDYTCANLQLRIGGKGTVLVINPNKSNGCNLPQYVANFVRNLEIRVCLQDIANGTAYAALLKYVGDTSSLPVARKCLITILDCGDDSDYSEDYASNYIRQFIQLLKLLTPVEVSTKVCWEIGYMQLGAFVEKCFGTFMNLISDQSKHITLDLTQVRLNNLSTIDLIPQVSSLDIDCCLELVLYTKLVHKCANTLVNLDIRINNAKTLFYDADNDIVVYPHLEKLKLSATGHNVSTEQLSVPNTVTLPSLRDLIMSGPYPFADDVLFRGNSATLRRLEITINEDSAKVLNVTKALENKYKNLNVIITKNQSVAGLSLGSDTDMNKVFGTLVAAAKKLTLLGSVPLNYLIDVAPLTHEFECLYDLSIPSNNMAFLDVLDLLKVIPNLKRICCGFKILGPDLDIIAAEELPDYVVSTYCAVGRSLQIVSNVWRRQQTYRVVPEHVLLLALVCPKLCRIEMEPHTIDDFQTKVSEALQSGPYSKYASQLNRILHAAY